MLATALVLGLPSLVTGPGGRSPQDAAAVPMVSASVGTRTFTPDPGLPTVSCEPTALSLPAGVTAANPAAIDPSGRYIVGNDMSTMYNGDTPQGDGRVRPILWTDGRPELLPGLENYLDATAVNADGTVVAVGDRSDRDGVVLRYVEGELEELDTPAGTWNFRAADINAGGDVVATAYPDAGSSQAAFVLLWKAGSTTPAKLPLPAGAEATDLADDGRILGVVQSSTQAGMFIPYVWDQQGKGRELAVPDGTYAYVSTTRGTWAAGTLIPSGAMVRWDLTTGDVAELPVDSPARDINTAGWIAGGRTVLRDDANVTLPLPDGSPANSIGIADNGLVLGERDNGGGGLFTWQCTN